MSEPRWTVEVDRQRCIGNQMCVNVAGDYFALDEGKSRPVAAWIAPSDGVLEALELCPNSAITIRDESGAPVEPS
ncbi:ferredoxin [Actinomadura sp. WMMA1423]|uniref:ferredoxin n=1 Tax=Actinomadura sp. WMMA1423 TaxID=2591108 RepID=UPI00114670A2|nr:ferredoxin [Actinomadura sp. WMMA1423]